MAEDLIGTELEHEYFQNLNESVIKDLQSRGYYLSSTFIEEHPNFLYHYIGGRLSDLMNQTMRARSEDSSKPEVTPQKAINSILRKYNGIDNTYVDNEEILESQVSNLNNTVLQITKAWEIAQPEWQNIFSSSLQLAHQLEGFENDELMDALAADLMVRNFKNEREKVIDSGELVINSAVKFLDNNPAFLLKIRQYNAEMSKGDLVSQLLDTKFTPIMMLTEQQINESVKEIIVTTLAHLMAENNGELVDDYLEDRALLTTDTTKDQNRMRVYKTQHSISILSTEPNNRHSQILKTKFMTNYIERFLSDNPQLEVDALDHEEYAVAIEILQQRPNLVSSIAMRMDIDEHSSLTFLLNTHIQKVYFDNNLDQPERVRDYEVVEVLDQNGHLSYLKMNYQELIRKSMERRNIAELASTIDYLSGRLDRRGYDLYEYMIQKSGDRTGNVSKDKINLMLRDHLGLVKLINFVSSHNLDDTLIKNLTRYMLRDSSPTFRDPIPGVTFDEGDKPTGNISPDLNRHQVRAVQIASQSLVSKIIDPEFNPADYRQIESIHRELKTLNSIVKFLGKYGDELRESFSLGGEGAVQKLIDYIKSPDNILDIGDINALIVQCREPDKISAPVIEDKNTVIEVLERIIQADPHKLNRTTSFLEELWFNITGDQITDNKNEDANDSTHLIILDRRVNTIINNNPIAS